MNLAEWVCPGGWVDRPRIDRDNAKNHPRPRGNEMESIEIGQVSLELLTAGEGPPLLFLHGGDYFLQNRGFIDKLARHWRVIVPRHPGFGRSERPDGFRTVHDLAYLYLDLLERPDLGD